MLVCALLAGSSAAAVAQQAPTSSAPEAADGTSHTDPAATLPTTPLFKPAPAPSCEMPLCYWASSLQAEKNHIVLTNIDIVDTTRGAAHITADRADATGAQLGSSHWVLTGNVHMDMPQGQLRADTATIQMMNNRIASIVAQGKPAEFQRLSQAAAGLPTGPSVAAGPSGTAAATGPARRSGSAPAARANLTNVSIYGHADTITYDVAQGLVQLNGNSWLTDGCNEFTSPLITYEIATQKVQAGPQPGSHGRVHGTIRSTRPGGAACAGGLGAS
jgi:lipopolysaccharide export system protein LptA